MKQLSRWLSSMRLSCSRSLVPFISVMGIFIISACSGPLSLLTGGGPNIAANTPIGRENTQQVVANQQDRRISTGKNSSVNITESRDTVRTGSAEKITVNQMPWWMFGTVIMGAVLFGSIVDDVIRTAWSKFRENKRT